MEKRSYDAVVVGSGPNGLAAAITMQQQGLSVLLLEGKAIAGGGLRSSELTLPGFIHDICSAVFPMAVASPFLNSLPLGQHGLEYVHPPIAVAHPFEDGAAAVLYGSTEETARLLGKDENAYRKLISPIVKNWPSLAPDILAPLHFPKHPLMMAQFGLSALHSASHIAKKFSTKQARGLWAGMAAHAIQPFSNFSSAAIGLVLMSVGHRLGWPVVKGGSQLAADALLSYFKSIGGKLETGFYVRSLDQLPSAHAVLLDVTPRQLLQIAGHRFSAVYKWQLRNYRYGMGVFKIDWALDAPIPFSATECRTAGTIHIGNTWEEISESEKQTAADMHPDAPFVLLSQPSLFDSSRAPSGKHTAWAYCHVPFGSVRDMKTAIEKQVERFAPGFRERILATHCMNTEQLEDYNPNYIGGDINGGVADIGQLFTRPALRFTPYRSSAHGIYICSSSTPPGGGVHGMCGYHAARRALKDVFHIHVN